MGKTYAFGRAAEKYDLEGRGNPEHARCEETQGMVLAFAVISLPLYSAT